MLDRLLRRSPEEVHAREAKKHALRQARVVVNKLKRELNDQGSRGVLYIENDEVWDPPRNAGIVGQQEYSAKGKELTLLWDLRNREYNPISRTVWESKRVNVGVLDTGVVVVSFSVSNGEIGGKRWLDESPEYLSLLEVRKKAAFASEDQPPDGTTITQEPSLEEKIRYAMQFAQHIPDGRYTRD